MKTSGGVVDATRQAAELVISLHDGGVSFSTAYINVREIVPSVDRGRLRALLVRMVADNVLVYDNGLFAYPDIEDDYESWVVKE
jgi:hypothetical protein